MSEEKLTGKSVHPFTIGDRALVISDLSPFARYGAGTVVEVHEEHVVVDFGVDADGDGIEVAFHVNDLAHVTDEWNVDQEPGDAAE